MTDRITTPLLLLHNDSDDAVPWTQGIEFYLALRRQNKEAYMFSYNGEFRATPYAAGPIKRITRSVYSNFSIIS